MTRIGFSHSEIFGSKCICHSPKLIAAYHVLHRLLMPRHPLCALSNLTKVKSINWSPSPTTVDEIVSILVSMQLSKNINVSAPSGTHPL